MIALLGWLLGCGGGGACGADTCPLGTSCEDGECVSRYCATSTQCALGYHCTSDGTCAAGCQSDDDCRIGSSCGDDGACHENACAVTETDCRWREVCTRGECVDVGEPYCASCTTDAQCGAGNICWAGAWCGVPCGAGGACPAGFACTTVAHTDGETYDVCLSACWLMR